MLDPGSAVPCLTFQFAVADHLTICIVRAGDEQSVAQLKAGPRIALGDGRVNSLDVQPEGQAVAADLVDPVSNEGDIEGREPVKVAASGRPDQN